MAAIKYRHNFGFITIHDDGSFNSNVITGNKIPALLRNGERHFAPFGGFIDGVRPLHSKRVKLVNIVASTLDPASITDWVQVPKGHYAEGLYLHGKYLVRTFDCSIKTHPISPEQ